LPEIVSLTHVGLLNKGGTVSLSVRSGQSICVVGPAGSGKSRLAAVFARAERPARGTITTPPSVFFSVRQDISRRSKPQGLAKAAGSSSERATHVLNELKLWDLRQKPFSQLSEAQAAACELIEPFAGEDRLIVLDGTFDQLDPWVLAGAFKLMSERLSQGAVAVVATNRPELVERFDAVIVLRDQVPVFAGSPADLLLQSAQRKLTISTAEPDGVRALVAPFEVSVRESSEGLYMQAAEGQAVAAKLLLEGYGSVKFALVRPPTIEDALRALI